MKPHIVIFSTFATPLRSGAEACAEEVANTLCGPVRFSIICARMDRKLSTYQSWRSGVIIHRIGIGHPIDKWLYPILAPFKALQLQPTLVHAVLESFAGIAMVLFGWLRPSVPRVLTCQSTNTNLLLRRMHRSATVVTVISSVLLQRARKLGRADAILIPNGLNLSDIPRAAKMPGSVLFVGRLEPMKGVDTVLKAFSRVAREHPDAHLTVIGEGSLRKELEQLTQDLGIAARVRFLGRLPYTEVYENFAKHEVFCALSRSEALGNVFLEAQAAGCGVVATRTGGIVDIVQDNVTGLLVEPDDPNAAAQAMLRLLLDLPLRERLITEAWNRVQAYDWSVLAQRYAAIYEPLLERSRTSDEAR